MIIIHICFKIASMRERSQDKPIQANLSGWDFDKVWIIRDSWPELRDNPEVR